LLARSRAQFRRRGVAGSRRAHAGRGQAGYDHSYYFMASFIADHVRHHARLLKS
jgi:S-formylglutathione hydrolase FrmB